MFHVLCVWTRNETRQCSETLHFFVRTRAKKIQPMYVKFLLTGSASCELFQETQRYVKLLLVSVRSRCFCSIVISINIIRHEDKNPLQVWKSLTFILFLPLGHFYIYGILENKLCLNINIKLKNSTYV